MFGRGASSGALVARDGRTRQQIVVRPAHHRQASASGASRPAPTRQIRQRRPDGRPVRGLSRTGSESKLPTPSTLRSLAKRTVASSCQEEGPHDRSVCVPRTGEWIRSGQRQSGDAREVSVYATPGDTITRSWRRLLRRASMRRADTSVNPAGNLRAPTGHRHTRAPFPILSGLHDHPATE